LTQAPSRTAARRLARLGTETAFEVSDAAAAWARTGQRVFPMHLGDVRWPTDPLIVDATARAIANGHTGYCPPPGIEELRTAIATDVGRKRGVPYSAANVSVQPGGKPVIGKFLSSVLNDGDEVLCPRPGYPIYESQVNYLGGIVRPYRYAPADGGFVLDLDSLRAAITPHTRVLILNDCHNPTGACCSPASLDEIASLAIKHDLWVLSDEAYGEMRFDGSFDSIVSRTGMAQRTTILYTFSKRFAMTGWRLGAAIGPPEIIRSINSLNINAESCTTHFVQRAMAECLGRELSEPTRLLRELDRRRHSLVAALNEIPDIHVQLPPATFYLFVDFSRVLSRLKCRTTDEFMRIALRETGVSFCTASHFAQTHNDDGAFVRFAYGVLQEDELAAAVDSLRRLTG